MRRSSKLRNRPERVFIWPDTHCPWHDKRSVKCALKALKAFKPDHLVILGDFMDVYSLSRHDKSPSRTIRFAQELAITKKLLERINDAAGSAKRYYIMGNHERRIEKYLISKAPEIYELIDLPSLLNLDRLGFTHIDYLDHLRIGNLILAHDIGHAGKGAHSQSLNVMGMSIVIGHTHRMSMVIEKKLQTGELVTGATMGWLGHPDTMKEYMPASKVKRFAISGFGVAYLLKGCTPIIVPMPIVDGRCVLEGKVLSG